MLREIYGNSSMSWTKVFEWHKRFVEGRENVEDDPKSGRTYTSTTNANIEKVRQLVRVMANELGMDKETVQTILVDALGMWKVCVKMVPRHLTQEQKAH